MNAFRPLFESATCGVILTTFPCFGGRTENAGYEKPNLVLGADPGGMRGFRSFFLVSPINSQQLRKIEEKKVILP